MRFTAMCLSRADLELDESWCDVQMGYSLLFQLVVRFDDLAWEHYRLGDSTSSSL